MLFLKKIVIIATFLTLSVGYVLPVEEIAEKLPKDEGLGHIQYAQALHDQIKQLDIDTENLLDSHNVPTIAQLPEDARALLKNRSKWIYKNIIRFTEKLYQDPQWDEHAKALLEELYQTKIEIFDAPVFN
jgi:hypothetical protein